MFAFFCIKLHTRGPGLGNRFDSEISSGAPSCSGTDRKRGSADVSASEFLTICAFDGRLVSRLSIGTQTDWKHKDVCSPDCKQPDHETPKSPEKFLELSSEQLGESSWGPNQEECLQQQAHDESVFKNMKPELEISPDNEMLDLLWKKTPQTQTACQGGTEEILTNLDKISSPSGSDELLHAEKNIRSENCQRREKSPETSAQTDNSVDPKELICSKKARNTSATSPNAAEFTANKTEIDRGPAKQLDQRLNGLGSKEDSKRQTPKAGDKQAYATSHSQHSDDAEAARMEALFPEIDTMDCENVLSFNVKSAGLKRTMPLVKHYTSGQTFSVIFPDGTGQVRYPSGRLAILVAAAQSADWSCVVVLEDKHEQPRIQAVFTNRGQGTCYHENGSIWVNLTSQGGTSCSETGDLKKHWSWLDNEYHVHAPPCQPFSVTLSPNLNIRIKSQEHISIMFTSGNCGIQLNVGAKLKLNQSKSLMVPRPHMLQRYLKEKSAEINVLLQNIQSLTTYQKTISPRKVKSQQSFISQMERRQLPAKQQSSAKKTP